MINFDKYELLTFDCYGTLIDWETGILSALKPMLSSHHINLSDKQILELYAEMELRAESEKFVVYKKILRNVMKQIVDRFGFISTASELDILAISLENWKPFPDTVEALKILKNKYKIAIISNIDDEFFALSAKHLEVDFDWIITSERVKSYKPSIKNFEYALKETGVSTEKILHVAQSIYHDIIPAKAMGLSTVWINRRKGKQGFGATPPARKKPDLEVPDLKSFVSTLGLK